MFEVLAGNSDTMKRVFEISSAAMAGGDWCEIGGRSAEIASLSAAAYETAAGAGRSSDGWWPSAGAVWSAVEPPPAWGNLLVLLLGLLPDRFRQQAIAQAQAA